MGETGRRYLLGENGKLIRIGQIFTSLAEGKESQLFHSCVVSPGSSRNQGSPSGLSGSTSALAPGQDANLFVSPSQPVDPRPVPSGFQLLSLIRSQPQLHSVRSTPSPWPLTSPGLMYCFHSGAWPGLSLPSQSYLSVLLFLAIFSSPSLATSIHPTPFYVGPCLAYCSLPPLSSGSFLWAAHLLCHSLPILSPGSGLSNGKPEKPLTGKAGHTRRLRKNQCRDRQDHQNSLEDFECL